MVEHSPIASNNNICFGQLRKLKIVSPSFFLSMWKVMIILCTLLSNFTNHYIVYCHVQSKG
jgi:hypothetical protein